MRTNIVSFFEPLEGWNDYEKTHELLDKLYKNFTLTDEGGPWEFQYDQNNCVSWNLNINQRNFVMLSYKAEGIRVNSIEELIIATNSCNHCEFKKLVNFKNSLMEEFGLIQKSA